MSITLYHGEPNGPSFTAIAALLEKGLAADLIRINLARCERHSPNCERNTEVDMSIEGEGPVLVVDGEAMADSVFIACYLDDVGKGPKLRPADAYARWEVMMWCRQIIERLAPAAALLGCKAHLTEKLSMVADQAFEHMIAGIARYSCRGVFGRAHHRFAHQSGTGCGENRSPAGWSRLAI
jgi:GSH-dependent disulfide-bond oxidoreductase